MDNKELKGGQDRTRINTSEDYEMRYWSGKFNVSTKQLQEAINAVGNQSRDVEEYLKTKK